jgi:uncharacterized protein (UPF0333 family)
MESNEEPKLKPKRKFKLLFTGAILILIIIAIAFFIKSMNGPAEGTITYASSKQSIQKPTQTAAHKYDGKYISFTYPAHYKVVPSQQSSGNLEIVSLDNTDHTGKYISIGVLKEVLTNDSGVNYRKLHPDLYKQLTSAPDKIVFIGTAQAAEQTGFLAHNGYVVTISVTANGNRDLTEDFNTIANNLNWKQ